MCVADDGDPARFYCLVARQARKQHRCEECDHPIERGERYRHLSAMWEGWDGVHRYRFCTDCHELGKLVRAADCSWLIGTLLEDAVATLTSYEHIEAPSEVLGSIGGTLFRIHERQAAERAEAKAAA